MRRVPWGLQSAIGMAQGKIHHNEKLRLKGSFLKSGFDCWRLVTCGTNPLTVEERVFFIEFYTVNPSLSPKECVLGFKNRFDKTEDMFQFAYPGSESAERLSSQTFVAPSFLLIRCGVLSEGGFSLNSYFPGETILMRQKDCIVGIKSTSAPDPEEMKIAESLDMPYGVFTALAPRAKAGRSRTPPGSSGRAFLLSNDRTFGKVLVTDEDLTEHPEFFGVAGEMAWNLKFQRGVLNASSYKNRNLNWLVLGGHTVFSGTIRLNGLEYRVSPEMSFGYYDKSWGRDFSSPYFHLSSSNIMSEISGGLLERSAFVVHGIFGVPSKAPLSAFICLKGELFAFPSERLRANQMQFNVQEVGIPDSDETQLHWNVSIRDKDYVLDIDVFCRTRAMSLRGFESPRGGCRVLEVLSSGEGTGKLKFYRRHKHVLELLEQADITKCLCEYGNLEEGEQ